MKDFELIELPKIIDERGNLSFIEGSNHISFDILRAHWIYDVPGGEFRGSHAFRENQEFIVALSGSFDVVLDDGEIEKTFSMNRSYYGLYVPRMTWKKIQNFSTNAVCLVLSSTKFCEKDYIRDYSIFQNLVKSTNIPQVIAPDFSKKILETNKPNTNVYNAEVIEFSRIGQRNGYISVLEGFSDLPFDIERVFYLYDIPGGEDRGAHAHKECHQFLVAASGSFEVLLDDGRNKRTVRLDRPHYGLHIPPGVWASEQSFSSGSICLVLTSHKYSEDDYIRSYEDFLNYKRIEI